MDIVGNDKADVEGKKAATDGSSPLRKLPATTKEGRRYRGANRLYDRSVIVKPSCQSQPVAAVEL
jgi:hypothetical protein